MPQNPVDKIVFSIKVCIPLLRKRCLTLFFILANQTLLIVGCILARLSRVSYSIKDPFDMLVPFTSAVARYFFDVNRSIPGLMIE